MGQQVVGSGAGSLMRAIEARSARVGSSSSSSSRDATVEVVAAFAQCSDDRGPAQQALSVPGPIKATHCAMFRATQLLLQDGSLCLMASLTAPPHTPAQPGRSRGRM